MVYYVLDRENMLQFQCFFLQYNNFFEIGVIRIAPKTITTNEIWTGKWVMQVNQRQLNLISAVH